jgi:membrane protease subunit (stomatin/prohibitin family)
LADLFEPGTHTLNTANLPILSTLQGWKYGFESPFKAEVYFVSTRVVTDLKWGTPNPIMLRDADFGPVRLRAFGTYTLRVTDAKALLKEIVGTQGTVETDELNELMRSTIGTAFADMLGKSQIAALDLAAHYRDFSEQLRKMVVERVDNEYGLDVPQLMIVNISLPEEVEKAIDTRSSMGAIGDMQRYQQFQIGKAVTAAAENPAGGAAAQAMTFGLGMAMANQMAPGMTRAGAPAGNVAGGNAPPPLPGAAAWYVGQGGQPQGPFTAAQVQQGLASGQITAATLVWSNGMAAWLPASQVAELNAAAHAPPPLPTK